MKQALKALGALLFFGFVFGVAFAQEAAATGVDIGEWFASTAALAAIVAAAVAFIKSHILKNIDGIAVVALSLAVGAGFGFGGHALGYVEGGLVAALGFGLSAGLLASGGWDVISGLLGKRQAPAALEE